MSLETVSMMDDCAELSDELHTIRQEWQALVAELGQYISMLRNPMFGPVIMRSEVASVLEDILHGDTEFGGENASTD